MFADINGEAIHASMGLPPALSVTTAKVGKLEIMVCVELISLLSNFFQLEMSINTCEIGASSRICTSLSIFLDFVMIH